MQITEDKIRQIVQEAESQLGKYANAEMLKKVTKEVVRRLEDKAEKERYNVSRSRLR